VPIGEAFYLQYGFFLCFIMLVRRFLQNIPLLYGELLRSLLIFY